MTLDDIWLDGMRLSLIVYMPQQKSFEKVLHGQGGIVVTATKNPDSSTLGVVIHFAPK